jgi:serine protease
MPSHTARILALSLASLLAGGLQAAELIQRPDAIPGQYIVVLHDETPDEVRGLNAERRAKRRIDTAFEMSTRHRGRAERVYQHAINGFVAKMSDNDARAMLRDKRVRFIEQDSIVSINQAVQSPATWGLDRIDQRFLPANSSYSYAYTGATVHAYIIDTGILTTHAEFAGRIGAGATAIADANGVNDCNGHGTHVAGTVGGATYGVAKSVILHPVRVLGCTGSGSNSGVIAGVDWVTANHIKPAVANMSLGGGASTALDDAVRRSIAAGVTYAIAAGNSNADACGYSPARVTEALIVGSTTNTDARSSFSNFGSCVSIFAPGSAITSAWFTSTTATNTIDGTSMAAPHVAGAAALVLERTPAATPAQVKQALVSAATASVVTNPGTASPNLLLYSLNTSAPSGDLPPVARFTSNCAVLTCTFDASSSTDDKGAISNYRWNFGDTTTGTGSTASKTFGGSGTFNVQLTAIDSANQQSTATASVTVVGPVLAPCNPCASATGSIATQGTTVTLTQFNRTAGTLRGWLRGPVGTDFDLALQRRATNGLWLTVALANTTAASESITYTATAGTYRWRVTAFRGTGAYTVWTQ